MTSIKDHVRPQITRIQFSKRGITLYSDLGFERRLEGKEAGRLAQLIQAGVEQFDDEQAIKDRAGEPTVSPEELEKEIAEDERKMVSPEEYERLVGHCWDPRGDQWFGGIKKDLFVCVHCGSKLFTWEIAKTYQEIVKL